MHKAKESKVKESIYICQNSYSFSESPFKKTQPSGTGTKQTLRLSGRKWAMHGAGASRGHEQTFLKQQALQGFAVLASTGK